MCLRLHGRRGRGPIALPAMRHSEHRVQVLMCGRSHGMAKNACWSRSRVISPPFPLLQYSTLRSISSASRLDLDHIVRGSLAHACGADADVTSFIAQLSQVHRSKVTHSRLDAADELCEDPVGRRGNFF